MKEEQTIKTTTGIVMEHYFSIVERKAKIASSIILVSSIMAGMFIAIGASSSSVAVFQISNIGVARTVAGCIFPIGLMFIVLLGGELFTGNCLLITGYVKKKITLLQVMKLLVFVYVGNFVGSLLIAFFINYSGQLQYGDGSLGAYTIKIAIGKLNLNFITAMVSGIICNILVCLAVLMAAIADNTVGKIWACFFPILAFVVGGYEHCVANMYYIPSGILAVQNSTYVEKAKELYGYTAKELEVLNINSMFLYNQLPVTIGNVIGGMIFVGLPLLYLARQKNKNA